MNVAPIQFASIRPATMPEAGIDAASQSGPSFMQTLGAGVHQLDASLNQADQAARALAAGDSSMPVHDVMIAMESARLKLQMAVEVRNRIVDAYQNLTNMQL